MNSLTDMNADGSAGFVVDEGGTYPAAENDDLIAGAGNESVAQTVRETALPAASEGMRLFPLCAGQKLPPPKGWQALATTDADTISRWLTPLTSGSDLISDAPPNIGVLCGNGLMVLDLDPRNGSDESFTALEDKYGKLPQTRTAQTPGGGKHYYFKVPVDREIRNDNGGKVGAGIDIKSNGGYVVLPGSRTEKGSYRWIDPTTPLAELPAQLLELVTKPRAPKPVADSGEAAAEIPTAEPPKHNLTIADARELLKHLDADCEYDTWFNTCAAFRRVAKGAQDGSQPVDWFVALDEWCARSPKYPGREGVEEKWRQADTRESGYGLAYLLGLARPSGYEPPARVADPAAFPPVPVESGRELEEPPPITIGTVPEARYATTDQANAARLAANYREELISVGGAFHHYNGKHWERNERKAMECGAQLSRIVGDEAQAWRAKFESMAAVNPDGKKLEATVRRDKSKLEDSLRATADGLAMVTALYKAEALEKWQKQCEGITNIRNAVELLRNLATVDADSFDTNPALLNCQNGTVDLRTGRLMAHDPRHLITHFAPVSYNPNAKAPCFEKFLSEVLTPDQVSFAQRWFGYCTTGEIREQKLLIHIGEGANGKGTLIEAIEAVLGDYSHTAPVGMLTAAKGEERHPTEIADLFRKRMVTASESDHDASLREAFIKLMTGGDRLAGRYMGQNFFKFYPTHKMQMLTNHKPAIKGSDHGIWRRILLLHYPQKFGTAAEIDSGRATKLVDTSLKAALLAEREGIFAWIVRGAMEWYRDGLRPPACVIEANEAYRLEQDRVGQFVHECCALEPDTWSPFSGAFFGLYPAYSGWCRESGYQALGMKKFVDELARVVPRFRKAERKINCDGVRKTVNGAYGVAVSLAGSADNDANFDLVSA